MNINLAKAASQFLASIEPYAIYTYILSANILKLSNIAFAHAQAYGERAKSIYSYGITVSQFFAEDAYCFTQYRWSNTSKAFFQCLVHVIL